MKLFRYDGGRIGLTTTDGSFDVTQALGMDPQAWPPVQMVQFIAAFDRHIGALRRRKDLPRIDPAAVRLEVPIEWPNKLLAFPANYQLHRKEMNSSNRADV